MRERLQEFALSLHPEKTRLIEFGRFAAENRKRLGLGKPETFKFLGFTFICGQSRAGRFLLKRKSRRDRMKAKLQEIKQELRRSMHQPIPSREDGCSRSSPATSTITRCRPMLGTDRVPIPRHQSLAAHATAAKPKGTATWERITRLADDWLPKPLILHPWPANASPLDTQGGRSYGAGGGGRGTFIVHTN